MNAQMVTSAKMAPAGCVPFQLFVVESLAGLAPNKDLAALRHGAVVRPQQRLQHRVEVCPNAAENLAGRAQKDLGAQRHGAAVEQQQQLQGRVEPVAPNVVESMAGPAQAEADWVALRHGAVVSAFLAPLVVDSLDGHAQTT